MVKRAMHTIGRRELLISGAASLIAAPAFAQDGAPDPKLIDDLIAANRILADQGVVDGFGHVSVRHDKRPDRFLIARSMAPGLVTAADIMELDFEGNPIDARGRTPYLERFIHAEIFRARPDVGALVHSHSPGVIPFTVAKTPLRAVYHMASFLGDGVPVFEIRTTGGAETDMLIRDSKLGKALATTLGNNTIVLLRGHGAVAVGSNVKTAVMHAVYTEVGAKVQAEAMRLGPVTYLNRAEAEKITKQNDLLVDKNWDLWRAKAMK
jgi:HCOMODA/2-hydroxy-3-carboxy-muconic semialdehyde decarboxylase